MRVQASRASPCQFLHIFGDGARLLERARAGGGGRGLLRLPPRDSDPVPDLPARHSRPYAVDSRQSRRYGTGGTGPSRRRRAARGANGSDGDDGPNGTNGQCAWPSGEGGRRHFQVWTCQIRLSLLLHAKFNLCCVCSIDTLVHPESAVTVVESVFPVRVVTKDH